MGIEGRGGGTKPQNLEEIFGDILVRCRRLSLEKLAAVRKEVAGESADSRNTIQRAEDNLDFIRMLGSLEPVNEYMALNDTWVRIFRVLPLFARHGLVATGRGVIEVIPVDSPSFMTTNYRFEDFNSGNLHDDNHAHRSLKKRLARLSKAEIVKKFERAIG